MCVYSGARVWLLLGLNPEERASLLGRNYGAQLQPTKDADPSLFARQHSPPAPAFVVASGSPARPLRGKEGNEDATGARSEAVSHTL